MNRPVLFNPAASGKDDAVSMFAGGRFQWIGYTDQDNEDVYPKNYVVGLNLPLFKLNSGIGVQFNLEQIGYQSRMDITLDYAYKIELKRDKYLALGLNVQASRVSLDVSKLMPQDQQDPLLLKLGDQDALIPEAGFGIFFNSPKKGWAGVSMLNLIGSAATLGNIEMKDQPTLVAQGQYRISVIKSKKSKLDIAPSLLVKSNFTSTQAEVDVVGYLKDKYWFGAGYRFQDGVVLLAGLQIKNLHAGLSYDLTTGQLREATNMGSVEIHIGYNIPIYPRVECHSGFNVRHL
jgi:type IX secretion system PorP/SprF family membrane protein